MHPCDTKCSLVFRFTYSVAIILLDLAVIVSVLEGIVYICACEFRCDLITMSKYKYGWSELYVYECICLYNRLRTFAKKAGRSVIFKWLVVKIFLFNKMGKQNINEMEMKGWFFNVFYIQISSTLIRSVVNS